jgi:hypothetical protein
MHRANAIFGRLLQTIADGNDDAAKCLDAIYEHKDYNEMLDMYICIFKYNIEGYTLGYLWSILARRNTTRLLTIIRTFDAELIKYEIGNGNILNNECTEWFKDPK